MERNIAVDLLGMCQFEEFGNELFGPVRSVEVAAGH
jgi:hypothetical protein